MLYYAHRIEDLHHLDGHCHHHLFHHHTIHLHLCLHQTPPMLLKQVTEFGIWGFSITLKPSVQKMEASIVDAIRDLKEAHLGKLDEIALTGKPSWPARLHNSSTTPVPRTSPSAGQATPAVPLLQHTAVPLMPQPAPQLPLPSEVLLSPSTSGDSPRCLPIREGHNHLPSNEIERSNLRPPEFTVQCHRSLTSESKIHTLALKLATESYFGTKVMAQCTVMGCTAFKGLPISELNSLKQFLFSILVKYWSAPHDFEPVWSRCVSSIGHGCTRARNYP